MRNTGARRRPKYSWCNWKRVKASRENTFRFTWTSSPRPLPYRSQLSRTSPFVNRGSRWDGGGATPRPWRRPHRSFRSGGSSPTRGERGRTRPRGAGYRRGGARRRSRGPSGDLSARRQDPPHAPSCRWCSRIKPSCTDKFVTKQAPRVRVWSSPNIRIGTHRPGVVGWS